MPGQHLPLPHTKGLGPLPWGAVGSLCGARAGLRQDAPCGEQGPAVGMASSCQRAARSPRQVQRPFGHGFPARSSQEVPGAAGGGAGSLPPALCWQRDTELIPAPFKHPSDPEKRCHLLPPAGTVPPGKGREGRDLYRSQLLKQTGHTLTRTQHPHTPPSATERSVEPVSHTQSVCARLTRYSTAGTGQRWLGYCTGVNVNNKASSERLRQRPKNSCFVQKCP